MYYDVESKVLRFHLSKWPKLRYKLKYSLNFMKMFHFIAYLGNAPCKKNFISVYMVVIGLLKTIGSDFTAVALFKR